jgi:hypothetical protein
VTANYTATLLASQCTLRSIMRAFDFFTVRISLMSETRYTPARPVLLKDVPQWDFETDVAIVGFGGAGACAALEAAQMLARR